MPDIPKIGTHSLRSGGASAAANAGVPDRLFKRHGRWLSDSAKDGYVILCPRVLLYLRLWVSSFSFHLYYVST